MPDTHQHVPTPAGAPLPHTHDHDTDLTGVSADDHHAQSHTHASHTGIGPDDHHPQAHTHNHDTDLTGVSADDHHPQSHSHASHTGIGADDHHVEIHSAAEPGPHTFPGGTTTFLRADGTFAAPAGGAGLTLTTVEVNLGATVKRSGRFEVAGVGMTVGAPVLMVQASGPYTGKGTRTDEAEMDQINVSAKVISATVIEAFWKSVGWVTGNVKFDYAVGG